jgi:hypothetical protein
MPQYQYHPDGLVYLRTDAQTYTDTPANADGDTGLSLPRPPAGSREYRYDPGTGSTWYDATGLVGASAAAVPALDAVLANLAPVLAAQAARTAPPPPTLAQLKATAANRIDLNTAALSAKGFAFALGGTTYTFGLTDADQQIWTGLLTAAQAGAVTFPVALANIDHTAFPEVPDQSTLNQFFAAAYQRAQYLIASGAQLKGQIQVAADAAGVAAVIDART